MATVYLAEDLKHHRKVAIKVLRPELAATLGSDRFLSEIRTTAKLNHPHILALHDSGEAAGFLFYVMPLVEGESLRERMKREKTLPVEEAVRLTREVAGEPPFTGPTMDAILVQRFTRPAPRVSAKRSNVPRAIDAALSTAMARAPEDRFPTVERFASALDTKAGAGDPELDRSIAVL